MKQNFKLSIFTVLILVFVLLFTACGEQTTQYEINNKENYTVSVRFDANGGFFTTNTSVIVDSFNPDELNKNSSGQAEIALISPEDSNRGSDAFKAAKNGFFLSGWYKERHEETDENGQIFYTYSDKWDFQTDVLTIDTNKKYSSDEPVMTLYAAWVPMFEIEFYSLGSDELIETYKFDPTASNEFNLPIWDEETGAIEMFDFPEKEGYTFNKAYLDADGTKELTGDVFSHPGTIDASTGMAKDNVLKLYIDWTQGEWYRIYTAEQFKESASLTGNYEICADLDFTDEIWPTSFMYGNFEGTIKGNGYTIRNVELTQTNNSKVNAGLFGHLAESAVISDLKFENVNFTIKSGTRKVGTSYGLFAGSISDSAQISGVSILNSSLFIDSSCYFGVDDYSIGLVCGMGNHEVVDTAEISCTATGDNPESVNIKTDGNNVTVSFEKE